MIGSRRMNYLRKYKSDFIWFLVLIAGYVALVASLPNRGSAAT